MMPQNFLDIDATSIGDALDFVQEHVDRGNATNGFNEEAERLENELNRLEETHGHLPTPPAALLRAREALRNFLVTQVALVVTEAAEAVEEIRSGHAADETWYSRPAMPAKFAIDFATESEALTAWKAQTPGKPEGFPSEIADVVIRCFHIAARSHFSLGQAIAEKLAYNATRGLKHGREF